MSPDLFTEQTLPPCIRRCLRWLSLSIRYYNDGFRKKVTLQDFSREYMCSYRRQLFACRVLTWNKSNQNVFMEIRNASIHHHKINKQNSYSVQLDSCGRYGLSRSRANQEIALGESFASGPPSKHATIMFTSEGSYDCEIGCRLDELQCTELILFCNRSSWDKRILIRLGSPTISTTLLTRS